MNAVRTIGLIVFSLFAWVVSSSPMVWIFAGFIKFLMVLAIGLVGCVFTFLIIKNFDYERKYYP